MTEKELATIVQAIAPIIREHVDKALHQADTRIAVLETQHKAMGDVRDRVLVMETKAATGPVSESPRIDKDEIEALRRDMETKTANAAVSLVSLTHTMEAVIAGIPEKVSELHDRVLTMETKSAMPVQPDPALSSLGNQIKDVDTRTGVLIAEIANRVAAFEARAAVPGPPGKDGQPGAKGESGLAGERGADGLQGPSGRDGRDGLPGIPGEKGVNGVNGKDGTDGLGFDDMDVEFDGERSFTLKYSRGERVKTAGSFTVPIPIYRGIFTEGKTYQAGDVVTYGGNSWHCRKETTVKPDYIGQGPQPKDFWSLMVKQGRDGKDGLNGKDVAPVVKVST